MWGGGGREEGGRGGGGKALGSWPLYKGERHFLGPCAQRRQHLETKWSWSWSKQFQMWRFRQRGGPSAGLESGRLLNPWPSRCQTARPRLLPSICPSPPAATGTFGSGGRGGEIPGVPRRRRGGRRWSSSPSRAKGGQLRDQIPFFQGFRRRCRTRPGKGREAG